MSNQTVEEEEKEEEEYEEEEEEKLEEVEEEEEEEMKEAAKEEVEEEEEKGRNQKVTLLVWNGICQGRHQRGMPNFLLLLADMPDWKKTPTTLGAFILLVDCVMKTK
ncbi:hypothetical protein PoB_003186600 [Plakobranchus ocellatus]|uniref:Uncharacterized protein n=1 Tax=Plakobranchus ocellatus TaxID=259542 RepID=A0AAV4AAK6_9GAST|nr:hypothetical protein PoB_003186600 [Plakobranchus ocellatus]